MHDRHPSVPSDWHEAFAALPLEAPTGDAWPRIAARLPRPSRRPRRALPWAVAAAAACLAAVPALTLLRQPGPAATGPASEAAAGAARSAVPRTGTGAPGHGADARAASVPRASLPATAVRTPAPAAGRAGAGLDDLYAESARLETLLAELSGPEPGDGVQLALTDSLHAQVAGIDDTLAGAGLDEAARVDLWRQRVAVLHELAGLAADQRWSALYGGSGADYALVQVY